VRRQVIHAYVHFDIFELTKTPQELQGRSSVFERLISFQHQRVREFFISLVNAMSTEYMGRSYLLTKPDVVALLVGILQQEGRNDTYMRQNALGTLQKFSLRNVA
jgi:hypothetical protein